MKLLDLYSLHSSGQVTDAEVASALGITPKSWRIRLTKQGHRLPMVLDVLDKISIGTISRDEASVALSVDVRNVNALMRSWEVQRPITTDVVRRVAAKVKWEVRKKCAIDYIAGTLNLGSAAESSKISDRQVRRWVSDLLRKHYDMPFKDLKQVELTRRVKIARDIQQAEDLEEQKMNMMRAVFNGTRSVTDEAFERVALKKQAKKRRM